jgi:hypothetical protein
MAALIAPAATGTLYSIGNPTPEEQFYLELINRARANPTAEGVRLATTTDPDVVAARNFFGVDLAMLQAEFAALPARPPLALSAPLTVAARTHTDDQYTNAFQGHTSTNGNTLSQRVNATGYSWTSLGENVFSYAVSVWQGHAGFQIDWGNGGTGGMQIGRGHRANIHGNFREVGIGVRLGSNTVAGRTVGPQLVTQDFASSSQVFVTGVAYYDLDGDNFYTPGEGVGGLTVEVTGSSYYAITTASGGYAVPIPSATTTRTVTFDGSGITQTSTANCTAGQNTKVDLQLVYNPPTISGPATPPLGIATPYTASAVPGASAYTLLQTRKVATAADPAESLAGLSVATTGSYSALSTTIKYAGNASYHLAHPTTSTQTLTYPGRFYAGTGASLTIASRLGWATSNQTARVEASLDGTKWTPVYSQAGTGSAGEASFTLRTASLAAYAGRFFHLRFSYAAASSYFSQTDDGVGWYLDSLSFTNVFTPTDTTTQSLASPAFTFTPTAAEPYLLAIAPTVSGQTWAYGPIFEATGTAALFASWAANNEAAAGLPAGTLANNPTGDYNADGVANLTAYALGLSPITPAPLPAATINGNQLTLRYTRDSARTDVTITPQVSTDLRTWHAFGAPGAPAGCTNTVLSTTGTVETRELAAPLTAGSLLFFRLSITRL